MPAFLDSANGEIAVLLKINAGPNSFNASIVAKTIIPSQKHGFIINGLKSSSRISQRNIISLIEDKPSQVSEFRSFWISNVVYIKGQAEFIKRLAALPEVDFVVVNALLMLVEPVDTGLACDSQIGAEPGLDIIGARQAWGMGLTGQGSLVCNFDTGVKYSHPALMNKWRGSNGGSVSSSWFDLYTSTAFPDDINGHGTHTMGTMVGQDGPDTVGVAFNAQWIAAAVVDRGGGVQRTIADILAAFQWAADPDGNAATSNDMPDVINNSWGVPTGYLGACDQTFWEAIDNLEALGIVCLFAAGNEGPNPRSIRTPADRITSQFNSFSVGAVNGQTQEVASFSSRGPSGCDSLTIKPEVVAPGVSIRSCNLSNGYRTLSGTSMATPHVAGAVALLRQYNHQATVDQIKQALILGATDLGQTGEDNDYGYGLINIVNSLYHMPPPAHPFVHVLSMAVEDNGDGLAEPGEEISFSVRFENIGSNGNFNMNLVSVPPGIEEITGNEIISGGSHLDTTTALVFRLRLAQDLLPGQVLPFIIEFSSDSCTQRYPFSLVVADGSSPATATIANDLIQLSFSNFGQYGLGPNSLNPQPNGHGFRYPVGGDDFMREAALLISANGHVSDGARNLLNLPDNDFRPLSGGAPRVLSPGIYSDHDGLAAYSDSAAENPLGVRVTQRCFAWDGNYKFIDIEFVITNIGNAPLSDLRAALFCDWDLPLTSGADDIVGYDDALSLGYIQDNPTGLCMGIRSLTSAACSYRAINNQVDFAGGFSDSQKVQFISGGFAHTVDNVPGNYSHLIAVGPYDIAAGDSEVVAFAFVVGDSLADIREQAGQAFRMYPGLTGIGNDIDNLPRNIETSQNYPNPFNNNTTIEVKSTTPTHLLIYDITGRQVKSLFVERPGLSKIIWDGTNQKNESVSTGVYFYRLADEPSANVRKMMLLK